MAEIDLIANDEALALCFVQGVQALTRVLGALRKAEQAYAEGTKGPRDSRLWIETPVGRLRLPAAGAPDRASAAAFAKGVLDSDDAVLLSAEETMRLLVYRFQDQVQLLQPSEAGRFGQWFSLPCIAALTAPAPNPTLLRLERSPGAAAADLVLRGEHGHTIHRLQSGGAASLAGLRVGDVLDALDGVSAESMSRDEATRRLLQPGKAVQVAVRRSRDIAPPQKRARVPCYLVRAVDRFQVAWEHPGWDGSREPASEGRAFVAALRSAELPGGRLHLVGRPALRGAQLTAGAGLQIEDRDGEGRRFTGPEVMGELGHRCQVPSCPQLYASEEEEVRELQWTDAWVQDTLGATAAFWPAAAQIAPTFEKERAEAEVRAGARTAAAAAAAAAVTTAAAKPPIVASTEERIAQFVPPRYSSTEQIARQKTMEAEELALQVLHLEREIRQLKLAAAMPSTGFTSSVAGLGRESRI